MEEDMGKISTPGGKNRKRTLIVLAIIGFGLLALATGGAQAARQLMQLNSSATFPVDI